MKNNEYLNIFKFEMPADKKDPTEQEILIEEKRTQPNGEVNVRKYVKGRFLGKVKPTLQRLIMMSKNSFLCF
jgi:hypothetical protein